MKLRMLAVVGATAEARLVSVLEDAVLWVDAWPHAVVLDPSMAEASTWLAPGRNEPLVLWQPAEPSLVALESRVVEVLFDDPTLPLRARLLPRRLRQAVAALQAPPVGAGFDLENRRLRRRVGRLEAAREEVSTVFAHDVRTPLSVVFGQVQMLAEGLLGPLTPRQSQALAVLERQAGRVQELVDAALARHRLASQLPADPQQGVPVLALVEAALRAEAPHLPLDAVGIDPFDGLRCDPEVFSHLLRRYLASAAAAGATRVVLASAGDRWVIVVPGVRSGAGGAVFELARVAGAQLVTADAGWELYLPRTRRVRVLVLDDLDHPDLFTRLRGIAEVVRWPTEEEVDVVLARRRHVLPLSGAVPWLLIGPPGPPLPGDRHLPEADDRLEATLLGLASQADRAGLPVDPETGLPLWPGGQGGQTGPALLVTLLPSPDAEPGVRLRDALLVAMAGIVERSLRPGDRLFRLGADALLVCLTPPHPGVATELAADLGAQLAAVRVRHGASRLVLRAIVRVVDSLHLGQLLNE